MFGNTVGCDSLILASLEEITENLYVGNMEESTDVSKS
jgi:hypothetical protein